MVMVFIWIFAAIIGIPILLFDSIRKKQNKNIQNPHSSEPSQPYQHSPSDAERLNNLNNRILASRFGFASKGETGENRIELRLMQLNINKYIIRNAYIPYRNHTSESDIILLTEYGIFVIESKNYSGWIFGSQNGQYWTQSLNKRSKYKFYNPIKQNNTHINAISSFLGLPKSCFNSLIVFSRKSTLKRVPLNCNEFLIIYDDMILTTIQNIIQTRQAFFSKEQIAYFYQKLYPTTQVTYDIKMQHINNAHHK